LFYINLI